VKTIETVFVPRFHNYASGRSQSPFVGPTSFEAYEQGSHWAQAKGWMRAGEEKNNCPREVQRLPNPSARQVTNSMLQCPHIQQPLKEQLLRPQQRINDAKTSATAITTQDPRDSDVCGINSSVDTAQHPQQQGRLHQKLESGAVGGGHTLQACWSSSNCFLASCTWRLRRSARCRAFSMLALVALYPITVSGSAAFFPSACQSPPQPGGPSSDPPG
jgi:hypothetical protein